MTPTHSNLEAVLSMAAAHAPFAEALARDRTATLAASGLALTPAEQRVLAAASRDHLLRLPERLAPAKRGLDRRDALRLAVAACAALTAAGCGKPGSRPRPTIDAAPAPDATVARVLPPEPTGCARPPVTVGGDARYFATGTGIRPDRPPPRPDRPRVALTLQSVESSSNWGRQVLPGLARGLLPRLALELSKPELLPKVCAGELRLVMSTDSRAVSELVSVTGPYSEQVALAIGVHLTEVVSTFRPAPPPPGEERYTLVLKVVRLP
jgi:hypothetical protein